MDAKVASADTRVAMIAELQRGVISVEQLHDVGVGRNGVRRRVEAGRLHRVHRGVYAVGHRCLSFESRCMAAILACGRSPDRTGRTTVLEHWGAAASHRSAAALWEMLPAPAGPVDVVLPGESGRARRSGIRLHRSPVLVSAHVTLRDGIPVTTPARTIADLRRAAGRGSSALVSARELRLAIRQTEVLGLPLGGEATGDRTRSDLERDFLRLCRRHDLPGPEVNVRIGKYLVDFLWRERCLVVETDGYRYHRGRAAFEDDRGRDLGLRALGYEVLHLSGRQVSDESDRVAAVLRDTLALSR